MDSNNQQLELTTAATTEPTLTSSNGSGTNNDNVDNSNDTTLQQTNVNVPPKKLTPEQEEELKLRAKYPNTQKPGGSQFIQKMLHKGHKKYFDSGDYNMAKSKNKLPPNIQQTPSPQITSTSTPNTSLTPQSIQQTEQQQQQQQETTTSISTSTTNLQQNNHQSNIQTPSTPGSVKTTQHQQQQQQQQSLNQQQLTLNSNDSSLLSTSSSTTSSNTHNTPISAYSSPVVTNLNHHHQHHQDLNNLTDNQNLFVINDDIIGHEIPTPECLPTRKHSVVQSKLATTTN